MIKLDWKKLNGFRSMSREKMEGLLRETREKKDPAVIDADYTADKAGRNRKGI